MGYAGIEKDKSLKAKDRWNNLNKLKKADKKQGKLRPAIPK